jgi:hypothetical protein
MKQESKNCDSFGMQRLNNEQDLKSIGFPFSVPFPRLRLASALACMTLFFATKAMAIDVANQADWNTAVAAVAAAGSNSTVAINITRACSQ